MSAEAEITSDPEPPHGGAVFSAAAAIFVFAVVLAGVAFFCYLGYGLAGSPASAAFIGFVAFLAAAGPAFGVLTLARRFGPSDG